MSLESAQSQSNEQEVQFKKRARRRLVGAVALVLLMVAVLPMVLDDRSHKEPPQAIAISIPSQDGEFTSKIVPVSQSALPDSSDAEHDPQLVESQSTEPPQTSAGPTSDNAEKSTVNKADTLIKKAIPAAATDKKKSLKNTLPADMPKQPPMADAKKDVPSKSADDKKVAILTNAPIYLQIGVFSDTANVKQLQQKLTGIGLKSFTEKVETNKGEKTRLRAGPFANRGDAEAALEKTKAAGLGGMIVSK